MIVCLHLFKESISIFFVDSIINLAMVNFLTRLNRTLISLDGLYFTISTRCDEILSQHIIKYITKFKNKIRIWPFISCKLELGKRPKCSENVHLCVIFCSFRVVDKKSTSNDIVCFLFDMHEQISEFSLFFSLLFICFLTSHIHK